MRRHAVGVLWVLAYVLVVSCPLLFMAVRPVPPARPERGNVWSLALQADGHPGMRFLPGQYGYLKLGSPYSLDEHPFSFSSSSEQRAARTARVRHQGTG